MLSRSRPLPFTCTGRESKPFRWLQGTTARVAIYPQMQLCVTKLDPMTLNADLERSFSSKGSGCRRLLDASNWTSLLYASVSRKRAPLASRKHKRLTSTLQLLVFVWVQCGRVRVCVCMCVCVSGSASTGQSTRALCLTSPAMS